MGLSNHAISGPRTTTNSDVRSPRGIGGGGGGGGTGIGKRGKPPRGSGGAANVTLPLTTSVKTHPTRNSLSK